MKKTSDPYFAAGKSRMYLYLAGGDDCPGIAAVRLSGSSRAQYFTLRHIGADRCGRQLFCGAARPAPPRSGAGRARAREDAGHTDPLTGLPDRETTMRRICRCLGRDGHRHALLFIDLDRFKRINDTMGHPTGDRVLACTAQALRDAFRADDIVGRMGGDEFAVLVRNIRSREDAALRARRVFDTLAGSDCTPRVTCSIGAAVYPDDGDSFECLYERADRAMYRAKKNGAGGMAFYSDADTTP